MEQNTKEPTDIEIINNVKANIDVESNLNKLMDRHSGLFNNVHKRFEATVDTISGSYIKEIADDKMLIFYNAAIKYDPSYNMKFSSFLGQRLRFVCLKALNNKKNNSFPLDEEKLNYLVDNNASIKSEKSEKNNKDSTLDGILEVLSTVEDKRIRQIFEYMYFTEGERINFKQAGEKLGVSSTTAKTLHDRGLEILKNKKQIFS